MNKRLLGLGLVAAVAQLFGTGCGFHPVARFRANHPCLTCGPLTSPATHPLLHPIQTRRAILGDPAGAVGGPVVGGPVVGPVAPPCHGCGTPGVPVSYSGGPVEGVPFAPAGYPPIVVSSQGTPSVGQPIPIGPATGGASNQLPYPNPMPPAKP